MCSRLPSDTVRLVVDPHTGRVVGVEDDSGKSLGEATPLDAVANIKRTRRKPEPVADMSARNGPNLVEIAHARYHGLDGHGLEGQDAKDLGAKKAD